MKTMKGFIILFFALFTLQSAFAQSLLPPFEYISKKKISHIHLEDGSKIDGNFEAWDRKKGLIKSIEIKNEKGKKQELDLNKIKHAYFPQHKIDKHIKFQDFLTNPKNWNSEYVDHAMVEDGYAFFEKAQAMVKKKELTVLLQLLNPGFSNKIKIYHDPFAKESVSVDIVVNIAGGNDKSYYISKDGEVAYKLEKKNYKETFEKLFGDCPAVMEKYGEKKTWGDFAKCVFEYNTCGK